MIIKRRKKSIQSKMLSNFVGIVCIGMLIIMAFVSYGINMQSRRQYILSSNEQMKIVSMSMSNFYNYIERNINMLAEDEILKEYDDTITKYSDNNGTIDMTPSINGGVEQEIYNLFKCYSLTRYEIKSVYLAYEDGGYIQYPETYVSEGYNPINREWYRHAVEGDGKIIRMDLGMDTNGNIVISHVRAIKDNNGNIIGAIGIDVDEEYVSSMLENIGTGETGFFMLIDNGVIIADGKNKENNLKLIKNTNMKGLEKVISGDLTTFRTGIDGEIYIANTKKVENSDFIILSLISEKEIERYSKAISILFMILSLIILLSVIVINIININKLTAPIEDCAEYLAKIGNGNFEYNINPKYLEREDEIGIIANGINDMKISLIDLIYEIKHELRIFKKIADESKHSSLLIYDDNYNIIYNNDLVKKYYRKNANLEKVDVKKNPKEVFMPIDEKICIEIKECLKLEGNWNGIIEIPDLKATINCSVERMHSKELDKMFTVVRFDDITEKLRAQKELMEYEKMKSQEVLRTNFFANISHELRTPLNIFNSTIQLLDMKIRDGSDDFDEIYLKYRNSLKTNCQRMLRLINNIVDITKIDVGFKDVNFANYDIVQVVEEITLSVVNYAQNKKINVIFDTEVEEHIIKCDFNMVERIMLNLLSNAIKFTNVDGNILVDICVDEEWVHIKVKDDGIGIPLDIQKNIFDRFVQSDKSLTRLNEGSGIGLAIVQSLVKLSEGEIYLYSDGKKGTEFEILLPNKKLEDSDGNKTVHDIDVKNTALELSDIYELQ